VLINTVRVHSSKVTTTLVVADALVKYSNLVTSTLTIHITTLQGFKVILVAGEALTLSE